PDAVSARAVLQSVRLPRRLTTLLEGESLLNDAAGLVLFRFAVVAMLSGSFSAVEAAGSFAYLAIGGAVVGAATGALWVLLIRRLGDDYLIIAASALICWSTYLLGEWLHVSGVIATVVAGLICGWYQHLLFSASVRLRGMAFWAVMIFLLEATVFILIGSSLRGVIERVGGFQTVIEQMALPAMIVVLAVIVARFAWVFLSDGIIAAANRMRVTACRPLGPRAATVLSWAGMRGVVTLAVALTLPATMPGRDLMLVTAFAVILATVLIQGMTLGAIIRWMGLREAESARPRLSITQAEAAIAQVQLVIVERAAYDAEGALIHPRLLDTYRRKASISANFLGREEALASSLHAHFDLILMAIAAGRAELIRLHRAAEIDDEILHELERDLDLEELAAISAKA
ncbi:MAG: hypothetical protein JWR77_2333, partial [Rhizorhabdus sp.]|nr:hypothetical protein [Rhizorhabdus sp.]